MKELKITLVHSTIGSKPVHRKNVEALGLTKLGQEVIRQDSPVVRGMIAKCSHLLKVEELD
ncbi:MAG: 50S ribosomal protein L30 [Tissierellia bacterium]|nr:50S ribosomal protein L30 [Tissierellia bacterium]